eukprot:11604866-Karenia_brevis.AAC.1
MMAGRKPFFMKASWHKGKQQHRCKACGQGGCRIGSSKCPKSTTTTAADKFSKSSLPDWAPPYFPDADVNSKRDRGLADLKQISYVDFLH